MIYDVTDPFYHTFLRNGGQTDGGGGGAGAGTNKVKVAGAGGKAKVQATSA